MKSSNLIEEKRQAQNRKSGCEDTGQTSVLDRVPQNLSLEEEFRDCNVG